MIVNLASTLLFWDTPFLSSWLSTLPVHFFSGTPLSYHHDCQPYRYTSFLGNTFPYHHDCQPCQYTSFLGHPFPILMIVNLASTLLFWDTPFLSSWLSTLPAHFFSGTPLSYRHDCQPCQYTSFLGDTFPIIMIVNLASTLLFWDTPFLSSWLSTLPVHFFSGTPLSYHHDCQPCQYTSFLGHPFPIIMIVNLASTLLFWETPFPIIMIVNLASTLLFWETPFPIIMIVNLASTLLFWDTPFLSSWLSTLPVHFFSGKN